MNIAQLPLSIPPALELRQRWPNERYDSPCCSQLQVEPRAESNGSIQPGPQETGAKQL